MLIDGRGDGYAIGPSQSNMSKSTIGGALFFFPQKGQSGFSLLPSTSSREGLFFRFLFMTIGLIGDLIFLCRNFVVRVPDDRNQRRFVLRRNNILPAISQESNVGTEQRPM